MKAILVIILAIIVIVLAAMNKNKNKDDCGKNKHIDSYSIGLIVVGAIIIVLELAFLIMNHKNNSVGMSFW